MDIGGWLRRLTSKDERRQRHVGIGIVGHRRKPLGAIAAMPVSSGATALSALASRSTLPSAAAALTHEASGEGRYLTVMFYDFVDLIWIVTKYMRRVNLLN